jgi:hypothetical protein
MMQDTYRVYRDGELQMTGSMEQVMRRFDFQPDDFPVKSWRLHRRGEQRITIYLVSYTFTPGSQP